MVGVARTKARKIPGVNLHRRMISILCRVTEDGLWVVQASCVYIHSPLYRVDFNRYAIVSKLLVSYETKGRLAMLGSWWLIVFLAW